MPELGTLQAIYSLDAFFKSNNIPKEVELLSMIRYLSESIVMESSPKDYENNLECVLNLVKNTTRGYIQLLEQKP